MLLIEESFQVLDGTPFFGGLSIPLERMLLLVPGAMVAFGAERQDLSAGSLQALGGLGGQIHIEDESKGGVFAVTYAGKGLS